MVQFRIHQNHSIQIQHTRLYRVNLNLKCSSENSHPFVCFLLLINTFLLVFVNDFFQLEVNPVQMHLLYFYLAVLVNSKLDYCRTIHIILILFNQYSTTIKSHYEGKSKNISNALKTGALLHIKFRSWIPN